MNDKIIKAIECTEAEVDNIDSIPSTMKTEILAEFTVKIESTTISGDSPVILETYYNKNGKYIGNSENFGQLVGIRGIFPEVYEDDKNVCSIGKSYKDGKWYGWSHRAINGFQIGDEVKEGDCCASTGYVEQYLEAHEGLFPTPVGFVAKTEEDCKMMAIAFAHSVS